MYYVYYSAEIEILACHMPALAQAALGLPSPGLVSPRAPGPGCNLHNWQERRDASAAPCRVMGSRGQPWAAVGGRGQLSSSGRRGVRVSADSPSCRAGSTHQQFSDRTESRRKFSSLFNEKVFGVGKHLILYDISRQPASQV